MILHHIACECNERRKLYFSQDSWWEKVLTHDTKTTSVVTVTGVLVGLLSCWTQRGCEMVQWTVLTTFIYLLQLVHGGQGEKLVSWFGANSQGSSQTMETQSSRSTFRHPGQLHLTHSGTSSEPPRPSRYLSHLRRISHYHTSVLQMQRQLSHRSPSTFLTSTTSHW